FFFFFSRRRRHTSLVSDWSSDVCSSDLPSARAARADGSAAFDCVVPSNNDRIHRTVSRWSRGRNDRSAGCSLSERKSSPLSLLRSEERRVGKEGRIGGVAED